MATTSKGRIHQMVGKLVYSRVLQNRLAKQATQGEPAGTQALVAPVTTPPQQQYYSSDAVPQGRDDFSHDHAPRDHAPQGKTCSSSCL